MSLKIISILLLLTCLNITLADQDCYVKLYPEENFNGSYVRAIFDSTSIKGYSLSEALILASNNPKNDDRLFIELPVEYMKIPSSEHVVYINCSECQNKNTIYVHNMF